MAEIRGEKLRFRKRDFVPLEAMPSAQAEDPLIVHCPPRRSALRRVLRVLGGFLALWAVVIGGVYAAVESGALDKALTERASAALNRSVGDGFHANIGSTAIRFSSLFDISVEARNVQLVSDQSDDPIAVTQSVRLILEPLALLGGHFSIREIVADGVALDAALLPERDPLDVSAFRIDHLPALLTNAFGSLDEMKDFIGDRGLDRMRIGGLEVTTKSVSGRPLIIGVEDLAMERGEDGSLSIFGAISINGQQTDVTILSSTVGSETQSLTMRIADLRLTPFLLRRDSRGNPRQGLDGHAEILVSAKKETKQQQPSLAFQIRSQNGLVYSDGQSSEMTRADLKLTYDFSKNTLEFAESVAEFGPTTMPLSGGFIDLDRLPGGAPDGAGYGIDLLVAGGRASVPTAGEAPFPFDLKAFGRYLTDRKQLHFDRLAVATPHGNLEGLLRIQFGGTGPEIRFDAVMEEMKTVAIKQLWPFWIAEKPRKWVLENIFGGTVKRANISVFIPQNRLSLEPKPLRLNEDELKISFDVEDVRMNVTGDIPPLRDMDARFDMVGEKIAVGIRSAASYFPSGRVVNVEGGAISIEDVYLKPLMADISLTLAGSADSVAELVSVRPIGALGRAGFAVDDFAGQVRGSAEVRLGLIQDQNPPRPEWKAALTLDKVDITKPFDGRKIEDFEGSLVIDPQAAVIDGKALVDGVNMSVRLVEPVDEASTASRERVVSMTLDNQSRRKLVPGLDDVIDGEISVTLTRVDAERQSVEVDLRPANLTLPFVGWSKGRGISAKARFDLLSPDGTNRIDRFVLDGDGFYAEGAFVVGAEGLVSADFGKVQLSAGDNLAVTVRQSRGAYNVAVSGEQVDARALIARLKNPTPSGEGGEDRTAIRLEAQIDRVLGFGDERISGVSVVFSASGGKTTGLDVSGVTRNEQAVVAKLRPVDGLSQVSVTTSDAGAVSRFVDLYGRIIGGLLNLKVNETQSGAWSGSLDLRNFQIDNEERLQSIVSTPASQDGRSLNNAVRRDIDVRSARFQRGFARILYSQGTFSVENGIVRGEQIGASFQGVVRDAQGQIDLTGTFMPAYGLNRLFGELPIIGAILGNGSDRGLLGITFKLTGPTERPNLVINPLSIIAPGVFRQIFEFR